MSDFFVVNIVEGEGVRVMDNIHSSEVILIFHRSKAQTSIVLLSKLRLKPEGMCHGLV